MGSRRSLTLGVLNIARVGGVDCAELRPGSENSLVEPRRFGRHLDHEHRGHEERFGDAVRRRHLGSGEGQVAYGKSKTRSPDAGFWCCEGGKGCSAEKATEIWREAERKYGLAFLLQSLQEKLQIARQCTDNEKPPPRLPMAGVLKEKSGDNLLSRFSHYHRPQVLNGRVRNGNGCGHLGMVTGRSLAVSFTRLESR